MGGATGECGPGDPGDDFAGRIADRTDVRWTPRGDDVVRDHLQGINGQALHDPHRKDRHRQRTSDTDIDDRHRQTRKRWGWS